MTRKNTLLEIWDTYNTQVIQEAAPGTKAAKHGTKPGRGPVELNNKKVHDFQNKDTTGPGNAEGKEEVNDPKHAKKEDELYNSADFSAEKFNKKDRKVSKESINNNMAKTSFDKLYEDVMGDQEVDELDALGVETGDEFGDDEGDDVTLTLDRDTAQKLHDVLMDVLGGEEEDLGDEDLGDEDFGGDDEGYEEMEEDEDDEFVKGEGVELEQLPDSKGHGMTLQGSKSNKVGGPNVHPKSQKASGKVKKQHDNEGTDVPDSVGQKLVGPKHSNKVNSSKTSKVGSEFFA